MVDGSPMHVLDAAQHLVHDYPGGAASLAPRLGKTHTTLCNEVTGRHGYKLGLQDSVKASVFADDLRILNAFAAAMRCTVLRLPDVPDVPGDALAHVSALAEEFGDVTRTFVSSIADGRVTANEIAELVKQWGELQAAGQHLVAYAQAMHEAGKPAFVREQEGVRD